ncbi:MAG: succinyl-CoA synthetase subunit beta [Anaerolineales bacterium]|nr:MAG: succinyl-CoA synthetase subunit beta [Anaerolineales bacterium]
MARLYEYQGKQILKEIGVPVPEGGVASTPQEARQIAERIGKPVAVKAQIWATGRFKAGGIKFANDPDGAEKAAEELLGAEVKGFPVEKVLVEERLDVDQEYYVGVIVDDSYKVKGPVVIFSTEGGVDIEEVAETSPEKVSRLNVDIFHGLRLYDAYNLALEVGLKGALLDPIGRAIRGTYELFKRCDARSAEVNPLILTADGKVYAADCRVSVDDASVVRHPELGITVPRESDSPPTEFDQMAWKIEEKDYRGVCFLVQMTPDTEEGGYIGYHAIGGGGALLAADTLVRHGLKLANYADTSGNPTAAKVYRCARLILSQPGLEGYCLLGAVIASQDQWHHAHGLVKAFREELADRPGFPVVILIAGNKEKEALEILREGLKDLPIRLELYGREYIHKLDFVAERMKALVEEYQIEEA